MNGHLRVCSISLVVIYLFDRNILEYLEPKTNTLLRSFRLALCWSTPAVLRLAICNSVLAFTICLHRVYRLARSECLCLLRYLLSMYAAVGMCVIFCIPHYRLKLFRASVPNAPISPVFSPSRLFVLSAVCLLLLALGGLYYHICF